mmetsp:Transcript_5529/g.14013  ORF Transcript_5529/g.14013 Transcript_5529/m.14013 type:complete len:377 (-) Transcript_5529:389-1519(-)|eukprot:CAMPEP_0197575086 /NCGR_PEP_ID=MMETSP1326-20131121/603_1 /TAXON_ID=1155430 /ORGANISM="Genus nov. species nov., Strain RCC2288" /LENGTH=376 /DNA_ID=CAMNT_0043137789 /DNA_START=60 /DNA_END=1190 /DNA_ORIENTATION=-
MSALSSAALLGAMPAAARRSLTKNNNNANKSQGVPAQRSASLRCNAAFTPDERRMNETIRVAERTQEINNRAELEAAFTLAGDNLVMVAIESESECTMADDGWSPKDAIGLSRGGVSMDQCRQLSASLARIAREADGVTFLKVEVDADSRVLSQELNVRKFPTYQYYKNGELLWQHVGAGSGSNEALAEGVLYYGGQGAGGLKTEDYITELTSKDDFEIFLEACAAPQDAALGFEGEFNVPCEKQLCIVDVGVNKDPPAGCIHIFPAVLSLARNTAGFTRWARIAADANPETAALVKELGVSDVPSFVFLANGQVIDRYTGSDRLELMNRVLNFQRANGIALPQRQTRARMSTAEAKEIARAARDRAKMQGRASGW